MKKQNVLIACVVVVMTCVVVALALKTTGAKENKPQVVAEETVAAAEQTDAASGATPQKEEAKKEEQTQEVALERPGLKPFITVEQALALKGDKFIFTYGSKEAKAGEKALQKRASELFKGWSHQWSGDRYGGPCDIFDEYLINGRVLDDHGVDARKWDYRMRQCRFLPYNKNACVVCYLICDFGSGKYEGKMGTTVIVCLYHFEAVKSFKQQLAELGFKPVKTKKWTRQQDDAETIETTYRDAKGREVIYTKNKYNKEFMFEF